MDGRKKKKGDNGDDFFEESDSGLDILDENVDDVDDNDVDGDGYREVRVRKQ